MSLKKITILSLGILPFLAGCSLPGFSPKEDFTALYTAHTKSQIESLRTLTEKLGYLGKYETKGSLQAMVDIPTIFSGAASALYDGVIEGYGLSQDSRVTFTDPSFRYETLLASGSLTAKDVSFISKGGDMYLRYNAVESVEMIDEAMNEIITKYNNVWLGLTEANLLETLSGTSEEDKVAYQMSQAIGKLRLDDIEEYLTKYPLWKEKKSLGTVDGMSKFEVELATENIIALINTFTEKSTGKGITEETRQSLDAALRARQIQGMISYNPKNSKVARTDLSIANPDGSIMKILHDEQENGWQFTSNADTGEIQLGLTEKGEGYGFMALIKESGQEVGRIDANIEFRGKKFTHFDAKLRSNEEGISLTLEHNLAEDGTFTGTLDAGMGSLNWNGKLGDNLTLLAFQLKGAMIGTSLTLDLSPGADGMLKGPLLLKSGDEIVIQANVGLKVNKELLHLTLEVANPETPDITSRAEIRVEGKREKWSGNIEIPENVTPFSELSEALRAIAPPGTWSEEITSDDFMTDSENMTSDTGFTDVSDTGSFTQ